MFWDIGKKRGWLINGTSALLHLARASLVHNKRSKFRSAYVFNPEDLVEARITHVPGSALEVLLDRKNRKLRLQDDNEDNSETEDEDPSNTRNSEEQERDKKYYRFQDRVSELFETLEKIIHYEISATEESGMEIKVRARKYLEGWDFKDLVTDNDPFYPRVAMLDAYGKGWVDFTRSIRAVTLFGEGFGDIIRPTLASGTCSYWTSLPHSRHYLAATFQDLKEIAELYGDPNLSPMRLTDAIAWHNPAPDQCHCRSPRRKRLQKRYGIGIHSEFAQVLLPSTSSKKKYRRAGPFTAFVFGHNFNFPWIWGDHGDPKPTPLIESEPDVEILFDTSSSLEARSTVTASTFGPDVSETTGTSQELEEERLYKPMQQVPYVPEPEREEDGISINEAPCTYIPHRLQINDDVQFGSGITQPTLRHERRTLTRRMSSSNDTDYNELDGERPKKLMKS